jgi:hypothetical protein
MEYVPFINPGFPNIKKLGRYENMVDFCINPKTK